MIFFHSTLLSESQNFQGPTFFVTNIMLTFFLAKTLFNTFPKQRRQYHSGEKNFGPKLVRTMNIVLGHNFLNKKIFFFQPPQPSEKEGGWRLVIIFCSAIAIFNFNLNFEDEIALFLFSPATHPPQPKK